MEGFSFQPILYTLGVKIGFYGKKCIGRTSEICCTSPMTGYFRDGLCRTVSQDNGTHTVCAVMTDEFLKFSASMGNDLITQCLTISFLVSKPAINGACVLVDGFST